MEPFDPQTAEALVASRLDRLSGLMAARDLAIVDELWCDQGFRLYGSEHGESAETRDALEALILSLFAKPFRIRWNWQRVTADMQGDLLWTCAQGHVELAYADRMDRLPYRLIGILQRIDGQWKWRLFSGSEPATTPAQQAG